MKRSQAYRYELKPNNKQATLLAKSAGAARFAYNWALAQRVEMFEKNEGKEKFTTAVDQHKELNALKATKFPWMYEVSKCCAQEAIRNCEQAFRNFWRERKKGNLRTGFPKFKKKGRCRDSFRLTGAIHALGTYVKLPRLGKIRVKENTDKLKGRILSATVSREADRWFVSFAVEREVEAPKKNNAPAVGIDVGLTSFVTDSKGVKLVSPKPLKRHLKRLARLQKKHSRKQKGSKNRKKSAGLLARLHRKVRNIRKDFLHQVSSYYAKNHGKVAVEDLNVAGMVRNHSLSRSISDAGWSEFISMLVYKCEWYGSELVKVDRWFPSSKLCGGCGTINQGLTLSDREWSCQTCGSAHDRDVNAARNILNQTRASSARSHACGDASAGAVMPFSVLPARHVSRKQEANTGETNVSFG